MMMMVPSPFAVHDSINSAGLVHAESPNKFVWTQFGASPIGRRLSKRYARPRTLTAKQLFSEKFGDEAGDETGGFIESFIHWLSKFSIDLVILHRVYPIICRWCDCFAFRRSPDVREGGSVSPSSPVLAASGESGIRIGQGEIGRLSLLWVGDGSGLRDGRLPLQSGLRTATQRSGYVQSWLYARTGIGNKTGEWMNSEWWKIERLNEWMI